jgi:hypothetical protein
VDKRYEQFCLASRIFYDSPRRAEEGQEEFPIASRPLPAGWRRTRLGNWLISIPPGTTIPQQGWKIHVSACLENANDIITQVWEYCVPRAVYFKFLPSRTAVLMRNAKYAPRGSSGKAVTIYPPEEAALERILSELDDLLGGAPGPYILSDLRYGAGPLYVRYGGFTGRRCVDSQGDLVAAIENPAGELVPDPRPPVFTPPPWVRLPDFLAPHLTARNATTIAGLPYVVEDALHFSNGGGVYAGTDNRTGERVVFKEARPHAGLAADGSDAVARLRREHDLQRRLSGLGIAPEIRDYFEVGGHHFLVEEFVEGTPLYTCCAKRHPLLVPCPDPAEIEEYTSWALRTVAGIERAVTAMHERGVVFNDLHMFNVMIRPDDTVALIDLETASDAGEQRRLTLGHPGFIAPRDRTGFDVDAYSLACLRLAMFMPLTPLFRLDPDKVAQIAAEIADLFAVPDGFLDEAVREIARQPASPAVRQNRPGSKTTVRSEYECFNSGDWVPLRDALVRAIRASATPGRDDRLFPGDIEQFTTPGGGLGIAYGAAGVLFALSEAAGVRVPEYEEWLVCRVAEPDMASRLGCYDGLAGVAWLLSRLGHADAALRTAARCVGERWDTLGSDLHGGLAGFSLAMLELGDATAESDLAKAGLRAAEIVAERRAAGTPGDDSRPAAGLLHGASGRALLFIRLYERTADPAYLDAAEAEITADLDQCVPGQDGALRVDEGWRHMPYLFTGSAGIGMVIDRFLTHRDNEAFADAAARIRIAARSCFYAQAGLFNGSAGMIVCLAAHDRQDPHIAAHIRRLAWHAVPHAGGFAFPGDKLFRLSMDLGTGTAGVLFALAVALSGHSASLPFLEPPSPPGRPSQGVRAEPVTQRR